MSAPLVFAELTDDFQALLWNMIVPVTAGSVVGISVVGFIHYLTRQRRVAQQQAAATVKEEEKKQDPFEHGSAAESRKSFRRIGNPVEVQIVDREKEGPPFTGYVINRSVGGVCIQIEKPLQPQNNLTIRPTNAPHIAPWVEVVVKNCRQGEIGYEIGCQFIKTPPWPILMMFG
jgi:PilZ domain